MREWNDSNRVKVLKEGKAIAKSAVVDVIAHAADRLRQLVLFDFAVEELLDVVDVEARRTVLEVRVSLSRKIILVRVDVRMPNNLITDRVQIALMHVLAVANIVTLETQAQIHLLVVHFDHFVADLRITVSVFSVLGVRDVEGVQRGVVVLCVTVHFEVLPILLFLEEAHRLDEARAFIFFFDESEQG